MKKVLFIGCFAVMISLLCTGCVGYFPNAGFSAIFPGAIYTNTTHASYVAPKTENFDKMEVLGTALGEAKSVNIMYLVTIGDNGIAKAKADALNRFPGADDIINMEVDTQYHSIVGFYTTVTTIVHGKAVKFKK